MPRFVPSPKKSRGRSGVLWEKSRATCLSRSTLCWICAGECPDFSWDELPFGTAAIDTTIEWPDPASKSVDHIIPISMLPPDSPLLWRQENLKPAHLRCNSARGSGRAEEAVECRTSRDWLA